MEFNFTDSDFEDFDAVRPSIATLACSEFENVGTQIAEYVQRRTQALNLPAAFDGSSSYFDSSINEASLNQWVNDLKVSGSVQLGKILTDGQVKQITDYFLSRPVYNGHNISFSDGNPRDYFEIPPNEFSWLNYHPCDAVEAPHLLELANDPLLLNFAQDYLGCLPTIYSANAWWSLPGPRVFGGGHHFHRDLDDYKFCTIFIFLTDVVDGDGAHKFLSGSHDYRITKEIVETCDYVNKNGHSVRDVTDRIFKIHIEQDSVGSEELLRSVFGPNRTIEISGQRGTAFMEDPFGLHLGNNPQKNRRLCAFFRYGLGNEYGNFPYFSFDCDIEVPPAFENVVDCDAKKYINRFLMSHFWKHQEFFNRKI